MLCNIPSIMGQGLNKISSRFKCELKDSLITKIYNYLDSEDLITSYSQGNYTQKEKQSIELEKYITEQNLWFDHIQFSVFLDEGAEQKVFFDSSRNKVIKFNDAIFYVNWSQYFEGLIIHNILFKNTSYDLQGFVKINSTLYCVVEQDYIEPTGKTDINKIKEEMFTQGFVIKKKNDYIHNDLGLIIEDLHEENVLVKDDILFFIDTVIYLK